MKEFLLIWLLIPFISYCQTDTKFVHQENLLFEWGKEFCITENNCFFIKIDTNNFTLVLSFSIESYGSNYVIDSIDFSGVYETALYCFQNEIEDSHVVFWKLGGEYGSFYCVYYVKNENLLKIGEWDFFVPCDTCDVFHYSVNDIRIFQKNEEIEFLFIKETRFFAGIENYDYNDWGTFAAGELIVSFNIADGTVRKVDKRGNK